MSVTLRYLAVEISALLGLISPQLSIMHLPRACYLGDRLKCRDKCILVVCLCCCVKLVIILITLTQFNSKLNSRRLNYTRQKHPAVHADCHYASVCLSVSLSVSVQSSCWM